ncbi:MAG: hypothetical protein AAGC85_26085, partial [Bacteroidota bacterium]
MKYLPFLFIGLLLSLHVSAFQLDPKSDDPAPSKDVVGNTPSLQELVNLPLSGSVAPKQVIPSSYHNYIMSSTYREASQQEASASVSSPTLASQVSYLDGLGR